MWAKEPCTDSPLFSLEQVVVTPHLGASTDEAQEKAGIAVAKSVRLALAGELVPDAVNVKGGAIADAVRPMLPLTEALGQIASALAERPDRRRRGRGPRRGHRERREDPRALRAQGRVHAAVGGVGVLRERPAARRRPGGRGVAGDRRGRR